MFFSHNEVACWVSIFGFFSDEKLEPEVSTLGKPADIVVPNITNGVDENKANKTSTKKKSPSKSRKRKSSPDKKKSDQKKSKKNRKKNFERRNIRWEVLQSAIFNMTVVGS